MPLSRPRVFVVSGNGSFPFKALSLQHAWPATVEDAAKIELACPTVAPNQRIKLATYEADLLPDLWVLNKWPVVQTF